MSGRKANGNLFRVTPINFRKLLRRRRNQVLALSIAMMLVIYYFCLPGKLFTDPYSTVIEDQDGVLLSAAIAEDGQWRFPLIDSIPEKFKKAIIAYEDKRFYYHPGVDVLSMGRAMKQNISAGDVVSGGSTLTMQIIRLSRKGRSRTILEKMIESVLATRLEWRFSKDELLALYSSHAPFGGNVVGLEAACWRYFGLRPDELSWGEAAMLAVLPNSPSLIHPGKNRELLMKKRNWLLDKLRSNGTIDDFTCSLAKEEPIPEVPYALPRHARHLLTKARKDGLDHSKVRTTLQSGLQRRVEQIVQQHNQTLSGNQIHNACALVIDVETGNILAYVGNTEDSHKAYQNDVDVITSARSTGSILKPFLYAAAMDDGKILKRTLLADVPTIINGFAPKNFSRQYDGAVPADQALIRSLNVPAVHLLKDYRYERFYDVLKDMGMTTLDRDADHYGLSIILGGAEGSLWDIAGMYASMARTLNRYSKYAGSMRYDPTDVHPIQYVLKEHSADQTMTEHSVLSASAIYQTFDALKELYRPDEELGWRQFSSSKRIAWKTGTSFGHRDGWAVGVTSRYVVGVWVGNADGEGRPGLTGTSAAAPLMFDIFSSLKDSPWFKPPKAEMVQVRICSKSGHRASELCENAVGQWITKTGLNTSPCYYHKRVHLSKDEHHRVHSNCTPMDEIITKNWFVLPPVQEYYYKSRSISYRPLPPYRSDCVNEVEGDAMAMVYPKNDARLFIPHELDGSQGQSVFELAHRFPRSTVFWHIDDTFIGTTNSIHQLAISTTKGWHKLTLVDDRGEVLEQRFEVLSKL